MAEMVFISGKGGTGKTTVCASLGHLPESCVLTDCDVDAANLHLLVNYNTKETHDFSTSAVASIDQTACDSCGLCFDLCRFSAISRTYKSDVPGKYEYRVEPLACEGCGMCRYMCPQKAVELKPVRSGQWFISETERGPFYHGRLDIAQSNSGRLVSLLRKKAQEAARVSNIPLLLTDGPPGIGCPVIASITGADLVVAVSEPSRSAFHDLQRIVELTTFFSLPAVVCINKYDINPEISRHIEEFAQEHHLPVVARLRVDRAVIDAQRTGRPYLDVAIDYNRRELIKMWNTVIDRLPDLNGTRQRRFAV